MITHRKTNYIVSFIIAFLTVNAANAQYIDSDSWAVTDALGRKVVQDPDSAKLREGKQCLFSIGLGINGNLAEMKR